MLPRAARLLNGRDFRAAYSRSQSYATPRLVLYAHARKQYALNAETALTSRFRIGFSISRKVCRKAHDRNLITRRLREITRQDILSQAGSGKPLDIVVVARRTAIDASYDLLKEDLLRLFEQASSN
jgi:ribonuclease P protein component